jgi:hypothetical protein
MFKFRDPHSADFDTAAYAQAVKDGRLDVGRLRLEYVAKACQPHPCTQLMSRLDSTASYQGRQGRFPDRLPALEMELVFVP